MRVMWYRTMSIEGLHAVRNRTWKNEQDVVASDAAYAEIMRRERSAKVRDYMVAHDAIDAMLMFVSL